MRRGINENRNKFPSHGRAVESFTDMRYRLIAKKRDHPSTQSSPPINLWMYSWVYEMYMSQTQLAPSDFACNLFYLGGWKKREGGGGRGGGGLWWPLDYTLSQVFPMSHSHGVLKLQIAVSSSSIVLCYGCYLRILFFISSRNTPVFMCTMNPRGSHQNLTAWLKRDWLDCC